LPSAFDDDFEDRAGSARGLAAACAAEATLGMPVRRLTLLKDDGASEQAHQAGVHNLFEGGS
jgi:hypothetical protein